MIDLILLKKNSQQPVCLIRLNHALDSASTKRVAYQVFELTFLTQGMDQESGSESESDVVGAKLLDAQFYDDAQLTLVLQTMQDHSACIHLKSK